MPSIERSTQTAVRPDPATPIDMGATLFVVRIPMKSAGDSDSNQPPVPMQASRAFR